MEIHNSLNYNQKSINNAIKLGINFHFNKIHYNPINKNLKRINNSLKEDEIKLNNDYRFFEYYLNSKSSFNNFKSSAKQNGFKFLKDIVDDNNITSIYERKKQKTNEVLHLISRRTGGYIIKYWPTYRTSN